MTVIVPFCNLNLYTFLKTEIKYKLYTFLFLFTFLLSGGAARRHTVQLGHLGGGALRLHTAQLA